MQVQLFLVVILIIMFLLLLPIFVQLRIYINVTKNTGVMALSVFGIKIVCNQLEVRDAKINIIGKKKDRQIDPSSVDFKFASKFVYYFILKILITKFALFCDVYKKDDAFAPCVLRGCWQTIVGIMLAILYTKKGVFNTVVDGEIGWHKNKIVLSVYIGIIFNVVMLIVSYIQAKTKLKRRGIYANRK